MGMVLLAMLCLGRPEMPAFAQGSASVGVERSGEVAALLRVTAKAQALEIRADRPAVVKFANGHPALPVPEAAFVRFARSSPAAAVAKDATITAPEANANQPRAPPSIPA